jgi:hypothetical protein
MSTRRRTLLTIPALVALLMAMAAAGPAQADPPPAATAPVPLAQAAAGQVVLDDDDRAVNAPTNGPATCHGTAQEASLVRMNDIPENLVELAAFAPLPGAMLSFQTPMNDADQILVTFTAEARVQGQPVDYVAPVDFLQVQILLDGVPMNPLNDLSFTTDAGQANAARACHRVGPGNHTVQVQWLLVDQDGNNVLTGTIDDWLLEVRISG